MSLNQSRIRLGVVIGSDNNYVPKAIVALQNFVTHHPNFDPVIIGTLFEPSVKDLAHDMGIRIVEVDLTDDFIRFDERPFNRAYPIECFYHLYSVKCMAEYDYVVTTEPDIYFQKPIPSELFEKTKYIGTAYHPEHLNSGYKWIMKDMHKFAQAFGTIEKVNGYRPLGGVRIYNIQNLRKIGFYRQMVQTYRKCWDVERPICGDDSTIQLWSIFNPGYVKSLSINLMIIFYDFDVEYAKRNVISFHFGGPNKKYWDSEPTATDVELFFRNKMIQFVYNNFSIDFIKQYVPEIYVGDLSDVRLEYFNWSGRSNFGDLITPYYINKFCRKNGLVCKYNPSKAKPKILSCGSIIDYSNDLCLVYGSGMIDSKIKIKNGEYQTVRGPITRKAILSTGRYCPPDYADPGLALSRYYKYQGPKKLQNLNKTVQYDLGIIPHYEDYISAKGLYFRPGKYDNVLIINILNENIEEVIDSVLCCERIVSSSLHGLIVSDSYSIPNRWIKFSDKLRGDGIKFRDYFASVSRTDIGCINCVNTIIPVSQLIQHVDAGYTKPTIDFDDVCQNLFFDENGFRNYSKYLLKKLQLQNMPRELEEGEWYALKIYWRTHGINCVESICDTILKKSKRASDDLLEHNLIKIPRGTRLKLTARFDKNYYYVVMKTEFAQYLATINYDDCD